MHANKSLPFNLCFPLTNLLSGLPKAVPFYNCFKILVLFSTKRTLLCASALCIKGFKGLGPSYLSDLLLWIEPSLYRPQLGDRGEPGVGSRLSPVLPGTSACSAGDCSLALMRSHLAGVPDQHHNALSRQFAGEKDRGPGRTPENVLPSLCPGIDQLGNRGEAPEGGRQSARTKYLTQEWAHASRLTCHRTVCRMAGCLRQRFWWPVMEEDVREFVSACPVCI